MAGFSVAAIYKAVDKFSAPAEKISRSANKIERQVEKTAMAARKMSGSFKKARRRVAHPNVHLFGGADRRHR